MRGRTNKKEWDTFSREVVNKKKFPVRLSEHLARDKVDLFNLWLQHGKDLHELLDKHPYIILKSKVKRAI